MADAFEGEGAVEKARQAFAAWEREQRAAGVATSYLLNNQTWIAGYLAAQREAGELREAAAELSGWLHGQYRGKIRRVDGLPNPWYDEELAQRVHTLDALLQARGGEDRA